MAQPATGAAAQLFAARDIGAPSLHLPSARDNKQREAAAMQLLGDAEVPGNELVDLVFLKVRLFILMLEHAEAGEDEEGTEAEQDPAELVDEGSTYADEHGAEEYHA